MHLLCMTPKPAPMLDVSKSSSLSYKTLRLERSLVCPHVSFKNPLAGAEVPPRESVETRSVVITRESRAPA